MSLLCRVPLACSLEATAGQLADVGQYEVRSRAGAAPARPRLIPCLPASVQQAL